MAFKIIQRTYLRGTVIPYLKRNIFISQVGFKDSKDDAKAKLNNLLQSIIQDDSLSKDTSEKLSPTSEDVIPKRKLKKKQHIPLGKKIVESAMEVAKTMPGSPVETEAQLLHKLLYKDKTLSSEILQATTGRQVLSDLLTTMPIEERKPKPTVPRGNVKQGDYTRAEKVRNVLGRQEFRQPKSAFVPFEVVPLDSKGKLNIFKKTDKSESEDVKLETWEAMRKRDLKFLVTHPPSNIYEQMILWTERGILWKFPIDNESGLDLEHNTDFTEHIFLEQYVEDWCPEQGPIRHFMELVCVGLSRNYWLSAEEKKAHMLWYKDFFTSKKELIKEIGAGDVKVTAQIQ